MEWFSVSATKRRGKLGFFICFMYLWGSCYGRFVVEKNSLHVTTPDSLKGVHECAIGNFGVPQYGGTLLGTVIYPKANQKACKEFSDVEISFKSKPGGLPTFVLADRGGNSSFFWLQLIFVRFLDVICFYD